jgi:hypothetical protein
MNAPVTYLITKGDATPENFHQKRSEISMIIEGSCRCRHPDDPDP